jgi:hypothetical protein
MASFDNLDKNQSYAMVGAEKDRSGFHGTTIQAVYSKPSENNLQVELVSEVLKIQLEINNRGKHMMFSIFL